MGGMTNDEWLEELIEQRLLHDDAELVLLHDDDNESLEFREVRYENDKIIITVGRLE